MEMIKLFAAKSAGSSAGKNGKPVVLKEQKDYLLLYKPPLMHSAGVKGSETSLSQWCASLFPETAKIHGWKEGEGGLLHRLDYDTRGLVLFARNQFFFDFLIEQQKKNLFKKEYIARCKKSAEKKAGFPPFPFNLSSALFPLCIESAFRPYGKGRKEVRPVIASSPIGKHKELAFDGGLPYKTELLQKKQ
ncbi:MAG: RNA pseudouridine synthase [Treponema sp.]|jgi:23S rRNA pseudouridine1911/1915/1917 synthase|nr:RNA pseudouridine synthase [Treponema sp.]